MIRTYGGEKYENKKEDKQRSGKSVKTEGVSSEKTKASAKSK